MSLNESIVEDVALEWFLLRYAPLNYGGQVGEQCRVAPTLIPAFSQRERGKEREAVRRLNPEIPVEADKIKLADPEQTSLRYRNYVPFWA